VSSCAAVATPEEGAAIQAAAAASSPTRGGGTLGAIIGMDVNSSRAPSGGESNSASSTTVASNARATGAAGSLCCVAGSQLSSITPSSSESVVPSSARGDTSSAAPRPGDCGGDTSAPELANAVCASSSGGSASTRVRAAKVAETSLSFAPLRPTSPHSAARPIARGPVFSSHANRTT
jgi:hypothetical protein